MVLLPELLLVTFVLVRVRAAFDETFALFESFVPRFVVTVDERLTVTLLFVAFSLVVAERVFTFVPDELDLDVTPSLVDVVRVSTPSLNEVLRLASLPLLLLRITELLPSTEETLLCEDVGRVPEDLTPLA